jgi:hypothetical protein
MLQSIETSRSDSSTGRNVGDILTDDDQVAV